MEYGNFLSIELAKELEKHLNISKLVQCYSYASFGVEVFEPILHGKHYKENNKIYLKRETNIYELAHICKEWAFDKGFVLKSYKKQGAFSGTYHYAIDINEKVAEWLSNTEEEAVFKACEWIMEQTK